MQRVDNKSVLWVPACCQVFFKASRSCLVICVYATGILLRHAWNCHEGILTLACKHACDQAFVASVEGLERARVGHHFAFVCSGVAETHSECTMQELLNFEGLKLSRTEEVIFMRDGGCTLPS